MRILSIRNNRRSYFIENESIDGSLESMQRAVDGYIETVTIAKDIVLVCDESGRLKDKPITCILADSVHGRLIYGDCFLCREVDGDLVSLGKKNMNEIIRNIQAETCVGVPCIDVDKLMKALRKGGCDEELNDNFAD